MAWAGDSTSREALHAAEDTLTQARAHAWRAFDALTGSDPQSAVDTLLAALARIDPMVDAVTRLGGDPRRCRIECRGHGAPRRGSRTLA